jgi:prefoldin subunit 5
MERNDALEQLAPKVQAFEEALVDVNANIKDLISQSEREQQERKEAVKSVQQDLNSLPEVIWAKVEYWEGSVKDSISDVVHR